MARITRIATTTPAHTRFLQYRGFHQGMLGEARRTSCPGLESRISSYAGGVSPGLTSGISRAIVLTVKYNRVCKGDVEERMSESSGLNHRL